VPADPMPRSLTGRIALAARDQLRSSPELTERLVEIEVYEHEELFESTSIQVPSLALILDTYRLDFSEGLRMEATTLLMVLIHAPIERGVSSVFWRPDTVELLFEVLYQEGGALRDPEDPDAYLTQAIERFQQLSLAGRLKPSGSLLTPIRVEYLARRPRRRIS